MGTAAYGDDVEDIDRMAEAEEVRVPAGTVIGCIKPELLCVSEKLVPAMDEVFTAPEGRPADMKTMGWGFVMPSTGVSFSTYICSVKKLVPAVALYVS